MIQNNNYINFERDEYQLYARQLSLPNIQIEGQRRLKMAKVLCVGAGGLGSVTLLYLVATGIGQIGIIDDDTVELSNLQRQIIYNMNDVGTYKVESAKKNLYAINNKIKIKTYVNKLTLNNAHSIIKAYDIVIDCTDNFEARHILSYTCQQLHKVHIYAAIASFVGQASVFNYMGGPNYNEVYTKNQEENSRSCLTEGVLGILPGMMGMIQATETIKVITGIGNILSGYIVKYDALEMSWKKIKIHHRAYTREMASSIHGRLKPTKSQIQDIMTLHKLSKIIKDNTNKIYLIDLRHPREYKIEHLQQAVNIPISIVKHSRTLNLLQIKSLNSDIVIYCNSNIKTYIASTILKSSEIKHSILELL